MIHDASNQEFNIENIDTNRLHPQPPIKEGNLEQNNINKIPTSNAVKDEFKTNETPLSNPKSFSTVEPGVSSIGKAMMLPLSLKLDEANARILNDYDQDISKIKDKYSIDKQKLLHAAEEGKNMVREMGNQRKEELNQQMKMVDEELAKISENLRENRFDTQAKENKKKCEFRQDEIETDMQQNDKLTDMQINRLQYRYQSNLKDIQKKESAELKELEQQFLADLDEEGESIGTHMTTLLRSLCIAKLEEGKSKS